MKFTVLILVALAFMSCGATEYFLHPRPQEATPDSTSVVILTEQLQKFQNARQELVRRRDSLIPQPSEALKDVIRAIDQMDGAIEGVKQSLNLMIDAAKPDSVKGKGKK